MFCANWLLGPAAGPKGVSIFSPKMGSVFAGSALYSVWMPKTVPLFLRSVMTQRIKSLKGIGYILSDMVVPP